jgi:hypothetical protein
MEFLALVLLMIGGPIAIAWLGMAILLFATRADQANRQGDLFDDE